MTCTVKTDNKPRSFMYRHQVPAKVLADQFSHLSEDDYGDGFFQYRGCWYHTSDFMRLENNPDTELKGWNGYASDSYFSGVVIKYASDDEGFIVGRYYS